MQRGVSSSTNSKHMSSSWEWILRQTHRRTSRIDSVRKSDHATDLDLQERNVNWIQKDDSLIGKVQLNWSELNWTENRWRQCSCVLQGHSRAARQVIYSGWDFSQSFVKTVPKGNKNGGWQSYQEKYTEEERCYVWVWFDLWVNMPLFHMIAHRTK